MSITINGVNDVPVARDDAYATNEDTPLGVAANLGLLANDTDLDTHDVLIVSSLDTSGTIGTVTWSADGSITYNPNGQV